MSKLGLTSLLRGLCTLGYPKYIQPAQSDSLDVRNLTLRYKRVIVSCTVPFHIAVNIKLIISFWFRAADEEWVYKAEVSCFLTHSLKCETWKAVWKTSLFCSVGCKHFPFYFCCVITVCSKFWDFVDFLICSGFVQALERGLFLRFSFFAICGVFW